MQQIKKQRIVKVKVRETFIQHHVPLPILNPGYKVDTGQTRFMLF